MSEQFDTLVVTGYTLAYEVSIPPRPLVNGCQNETVRLVELGASLIDRLIPTFVNLRPFPHCVTRPEPSPGGRCQRWSMVWSPPRDATKEEKPKSLRIQSVAVVSYDTSRRFEPIRQSILPASGVKSKVATYVYLDASSDYIYEELVSPTSDLVMVHLANTDDITEKQRNCLREFLQKVLNTNAPTILLTGDRLLNALGFPLTQDRSWEAFADDCVRELGETHALDNLSGLRRVFAKFEHMIVRHNAFAAVHFQNGGRQRLHYVVYPKHQFSSAPGFLRGPNDLLGASVMAQLVKHGYSPDVVDDGIADGLKRCSEFDEQGFFDSSLSHFYDLNQIERIMQGRSRPTARSAATTSRPRTPASGPRRGRSLTCGSARSVGRRGP